MELAGTVDGLANAGVPPEPPDGIGNISRKDVGLYLWGQGKDDRPAGIILWGEGDVQLGHGLEDGTHGLDGIGIYYLLVRFALLLGITTVVDELHLLEHRRLGQEGFGCQDIVGGRMTGGEGYLARLASTKQQHLDLVLGHNLVSPELILDLLIACEGNVRNRRVS